MERPMIPRLVVFVKLLCTYKSLEELVKIQNLLSVGLGGA